MALVTALITRVRLSDICSNHLILQDQGFRAYNTYGKKLRQAKLGYLLELELVQLN